jgi:signal transduction histidine kinase
MTSPSERGSPLHEAVDRPGRGTGGNATTPLLSREAAIRAAHGTDPSEPDELALLESTDAPPEPMRLGPALPFRARLTLALVAAAIVPLAGFGVVILAGTRGDADPNLTRLLFLAIAISAILAVLVAYLLAADLTRPLRQIAAAVDRVSTGDLTTPIAVSGDDELARLADSHNRLAADLERRNRELGRILAALATASPRDGVELLVAHAAHDAKAAFEMIDADVRLVDPATVEVEEDVPGDPRPVRAVLRIGDEAVGLIVGHLPATRAWERADQDLLELFASEVAVAIRNAELFAQVEAQNEQLLALHAAKDDFLRGVSHNLQTPLTSIRAYAEQLRGDRDDHRLGIIAEQSERLSRMVRQLLTVTRLESGALRPRPDVLALGPRIRRAWEALGAPDVELTLVDRSEGWLAVADADQLDQVLWALLDNALKYGGRAPVDVEIAIAGDDRLRATIADRGQGVAAADRDRLFARFARGSERGHEEGSGLGLYVSRELCRAMGGDLELEPAEPEGGAAFTIVLPGEPPEA